MARQSVNPDSGTPSLRSRPGWNRGRVVFLAVSGALAVAGLWAVREVLLPFVLAIIIAYVLTPLVELCERVYIRRSLAILLVYAATFSLIYASTAVVAPRLYRESAQMALDTPALARSLAAKWSPRVDAWMEGLMRRLGHPIEPIPPEPAAAVDIRPRADGSFGIEVGAGVEIVQDSPKRWRIQPVQPQAFTGFRAEEFVNDSISAFGEFVTQNAITVLKFGQVVVSRSTRAIFLVFMTLMVAGYIMHTRETVVGFFRSLPPPQARQSFDRLLVRIDRGMSGVVRGQLLICLVNGVLSALGFWIFDLKYWPILSIIAGVMSIIPIFGSILSSIPAVLIGLTQDFWTALWVLLWIIGIHQIEANVLNPKIIGVAARIHPVLVVFALIIGEHFHGLWGALLAVPLLSLAQSIFNHFRFESLPDAEPDSIAPPRVEGRASKVG